MHVRRKSQAESELASTELPPAIGLIQRAKGSIGFEAVSIFYGKVQGKFRSDVGGRIDQVRRARGGSWWKIVSVRGKGLL